MGVGSDLYPRHLGWPAAAMRVTTTAGKTAWSGLPVGTPQLSQLPQLSQSQLSQLSQLSQPQLSQLAQLSQLSQLSQLPQRSQSSALLSYPILGWPGLAGVMFRSYPYVVALDTVAYLIAFGVQLWWIVGTKETMPAPAYILCGGYLIMLLISLIMLIGLALKRPRYLLAWLLVMIVFFFPEMGMVLFMSIYHWNIESDYGLGDLIFYICRAGLNLVSLICIQSLHATWREEKFSLHRLESFNLKVGPAVMRNGIVDRAYHNGAISYTNGVAVAAPTLVRSVSSASQYAAAARSGRSQFNAAFYGLGGGGPVVRTQSAMGGGVGDYAPFGYEVPHLVYVPRYGTQSLDRRKLGRGPRRSTSMDALNLGGPLVPGVTPCHCWMATSRGRRQHESRSSLGAESDSYRYRDVAL